MLPGTHAEARRLISTAAQLRGAKEGLREWEVVGERGDVIEVSGCGFFVTGKNGLLMIGYPRK